MRVYIYALVDPTSGAVRYVGQTINIEVRLACHISGQAGDSPAKRNWIKGLKAAGLRPLIEVLEECPSRSIADTREQHWIQHHITQGASLFNSTPGRPATGVNYPYKVNGYVDRRTLWRLQEFMRRTKRSEAFMVRDSLERALDAEGVREPSEAELESFGKELGDRKQIQPKKKAGDDA